jgi:hypothetical protein
MNHEMLRLVIPYVTGALSYAAVSWFLQRRANTTARGETPTSRGFWGNWPYGAAYFVGFLAGLAMGWLFGLWKT